MNANSNLNTDKLSFVSDGVRATTLDLEVKLDKALAKNRKLRKKIKALQAEIAAMIAAEDNQTTSTTLSKFTKKGSI